MSEGIDAGNTKQRWRVDDGSARKRMEAHGSTRKRMEAHGSTRKRMEAYGSARKHEEAQAESGNRLQTSGGDEQ
jgi:hypothetical protein